MSYSRITEDVTFEDLRDSVARAHAAHVRTITHASKKERKVALARAALSVWPTSGPVTVDVDGRAIFVGREFLQIGRLHFHAGEGSR